MSGVFGILNIGKSGIEANQAGLSASSQNVSNVNTPGYSEEEVHFAQGPPSNGNPGMVGSGARATAVRRVVNTFLENQLTRQKTRMGYWESSRIALSELDTYFTHAQNEGLSRDISRFMSSWEMVANHPLDRAARATLISYGQSVSEDFHQMAGLYSQTKDRLSDMATEAVRHVNADLTKIADLNRQILRVEAGGQHPNTLIDERMRLVRDVSKKMSAHFFTDKNGAITLHLGGQSAITDIDAGQLKTVFDPTHDRIRILITPPGYSGPPIDITDRIQGGEVGGYLDVRDKKLAAMQNHLNVLAHAIINHVNAQHVQGYGLSGKTNLNFFKPTVMVRPEGPMSPGVSVTANAVDPSQAVDPLKVAVSGNSVTVTDARSGKVLRTASLTGGSETLIVHGYSVRVTGGAKSAGSFMVGVGNDAAGAALGMSVETVEPDDVGAASRPVGSGTNQGDNKNAHRIFALTQTRVKFVGQEMDMTFHDFFGSGVAELGTWARNARDHYMAQSVIMKGLENQRLSVSGVSIANESAKIIQYEKAYQASANLIHMTNQMLDTLVHLTSASS
jgi:flagellar hook-associated protein 1 FlgK